MRLIFMGTPDFSCPTLQALMDAGHDVAAVYTQPPRPANRGKKATKSAVHQLAQSLGLPVRTPKSMRDEAEQEAFAALAAELAVVIAFGQILPEPVLRAPKHGCINLHASLLPRWRGAAPIQRAIMAGDTQTGVMVMEMEKGLDTGPVALTGRVDITPNMTAGELHDKLQKLSADLAVEAIEKLAAGSLKFKAQPEQGVTYASKIEKSETRIDWQATETQVHNHIRGLSPFPGAWFELELPTGKRERVKVLRSARARRPSVNAAPGTVLDDKLLIACGEGAVRLVTLQRAGKRMMEADEFLRGISVPESTRVY